MSQVRGRPKGAPKAPPAKVEVPTTILNEQMSTYAFGTVVTGAVMVAAAAWMGGSLASIDERLQSGFDVLADAAGFTLDHVSVEGLDPRARADVLNALAVEAGENMFRADPYVLKQRIETLDSVTQIRVLRQWPDEVWVIAEPRIPTALWQTDGMWRVIDQSGEPLDTVDPARHQDLPRVVGAEGGAATPKLLELLADQPDFAAHVATALRVGERRWDLRMDSGMEISMPEDELFDEALDNVVDLNTRTGVLDGGATRIDARDPERFAIGVGGQSVAALSPAAGGV